jgi:ATP-dependent Clp protease ATP-binding subunit ClpC
MFERYTDKARRTIFFSRYEASNEGASWIETEHLLLGLLREDRSLRDRLPAGAAEHMRKRIEERVPRPFERKTTPVDLPLSQNSKAALAFADDESKALGHSSIDCGHLLLGILRIETSLAAVLLGEFGIAYGSYREVVAKPPISPAGPQVQSGR